MKPTEVRDQPSNAQTTENPVGGTWPNKTETRQGAQPTGRYRPDRATIKLDDRPRPAARMPPPMNQEIICGCGETVPGKKEFLVSHSTRLNTTGRCALL